MHRVLNCYLQMMLEFERLSTVGALEPSEHLVLLVADHVALQSVDIGKHLPTNSTVLTKLELRFYTFEHAALQQAKHLDYYLPRDFGPRDQEGRRGRGRGGSEVLIRI